MTRSSSVQEQELANWIIDESRRGLHPTRRRIRELAQRILTISGDNQPLGRNWVTHFLKCNPRIQSTIGKRLDTQRANGASVEALQAFCDRFRAIQHQFNVLAEDIWNANETGFQLSETSNGRVLTDITIKRVTVKAPINREHVTVLETVSAVGSKILPLYIFRGKRL